MKDLKNNKNYSITTILIAINAVMFTMQSLIPKFTDTFIMYPISSSNHHFYQYLTSFFLHDGAIHIVLNMIVLYMFGNLVEQKMKSYKYITIYLLSGILVDVILYAVFRYENLSLGASGAIFSIVVIFSLLYPNEKLWLFFIFPIKAKYIYLLIIIEVLLAIFRMDGDNVGHEAHVIGALLGYLFYLLFNLRKNYYQY